VKYGNLANRLLTAAPAWHPFDIAYLCRMKLQSTGTPRARPPVYAVLCEQQDLGSNARSWSARFLELLKFRFETDFPEESRSETLAPRLLFHRRPPRDDHDAQMAHTQSPARRRCAVMQFLDPACAGNDSRLDRRAAAARMHIVRAAPITSRSILAA
jgi:hypothetical protein